jgi:hypothetical protein
MSLEGGLLKETPFPVLKRMPSSVEDSIISLFSNQPCSQDEELHEECIRPLVLSFFHRAVEV